MTHPRGRAAGSAPRARLLAAACCGVALTAATAACADKDNTPLGTPTAAQSIEFGASAVPAPAASLSLVPAPPGMGCAEPGPAVKKPPSTVFPQRSRGTGPNDAGNPTVGRRGTGPNDAGNPTDTRRGTGPNDAGPNDAGPRAKAGAVAPVPSGTDSADDRRRKALESQQVPVPRRGEVPEAAIPGAEACVRLLQIEFSLQTASTGATPADAMIEAALVKVGLRNPVVSPGPAFAASTGSACLIGTFTGTKPSMVIAPLSGPDGCRP